MRAGFCGGFVADTLGSSPAVAGFLLSPFSPSRLNFT